MLKTNTDSVITLSTLKSSLSCSGCGAVGIAGSESQGIEAEYLIDKEKYNYLLNHQITKVRIYTTDGYLENEVPTKKAQVFINELKLVRSL